MEEVHTSGRPCPQVDNPGQYILNDASTNGTFVNGIRVPLVKRKVLERDVETREVVLNNKDLIELVTPNSGLAFRFRAHERAGKETISLDQNYQPIY